MINSLLIANRGEIACRIIRTAREMGIRTVAVYSDADAKALHVREADETVHIGPSPARESYLIGEKIIAAAKATGAEAIHPGYGFLSENAEFAQAVADAGLVWVGPKPSSITAMGLKDAAKKLMAEAGVPVTPGYMGANQDPAFLAVLLRHSVTDRLHRSGEKGHSANELLRLVLRDHHPLRLDRPVHIVRADDGDQGFVLTQGKRCRRTGVLLAFDSCGIRVGRFQATREAPDQSQRKEGPYRHRRHENHALLLSETPS